MTTLSDQVQFTLPISARALVSARREVNVKVRSRQSECESERFSPSRTVFAWLYTRERLEKTETISNLDATRWRQRIMLISANLNGQRSRDGFASGDAVTLCADDVGARGSRGDVCDVDVMPVNGNRVC